MMLTWGMEGWLNRFKRKNTVTIIYHLPYLSSLSFGNLLKDPSFRHIALAFFASDKVLYHLTNLWAFPIRTGLVCTQKAWRKALYYRRIGRGHELGLVAPWLSIRCLEWPRVFTDAHSTHAWNIRNARCLLIAATPIW